MKNTSTILIDQHSKEFTKPICAIVGPTASGKTALAVELAESIQAEILCVDAMQVYRGLDIGTAKPTKDEQQKVLHHGIDIVSPLENFNAFRFAEYAEPILQHTLSQNQPLVLCGGTGLYFRALLEGFFEVPDPNSSIRDKLARTLEEKGSNSLYEELKEKDPSAAEGIHPNDARRILRALEIMEQTGETVSQLRQKQLKKPWISKTFFIGLDWERDELDRRIEERTVWMYQAGLIEETQWLLKIGCDRYYTVMQALGYKECAEHLQSKIPMQDAIDLTIKGTRRYARRQLTWFRRQWPVHWISVSNQKELNEICYESLQLWRNSGNNTFNK